MTAVTMPVIPSARPLAPGRLKAFHQIADAHPVPFAIAVTGDWIRASGRLNHNVRPNHSRRNLYRSDLANRNALLVAAEQTPLHAAHAQRADYDTRRTPQIPLRPAARGKGLFGSRRIRTGRGLTGGGCSPSQTRLFPT